MRVVIVGGGIGGLTLALMLKARAIACEIYEASARIRELGVGINVLPHAIRGAGRARAAAAARRGGGAHARADLRQPLRAGDLARAARAGCGLQGAAVLDPPRPAAGRAARRRGRAARAQGDPHRPRVRRRSRKRRARSRRGSSRRPAARAPRWRATSWSAATASIRPCAGSSIRARPGSSWNGVLMWRGATNAKGFLDGRTMIVAGGFNNKLVLYPIGKGSKPGTQLVNWVVTYRMGDGSTPPPRREDWNRHGTLAELMPHVARFSTPHVDLVKLVKGAPAFFEYPMADRDPLPRWTHGRVTLLGDAAHPMYPVGSNGASQAILDARCLADLLARLRARAPRAGGLRGGPAAEDGRDRAQQPQGRARGRDRRGRAPRARRLRRHRRRAEPRPARSHRQGLRPARRLRQGAGESR